MGKEPFLSLFESNDDIIFEPKSFDDFLESDIKDAVLNHTPVYTQKNKIDANNKITYSQFSANTIKFSLTVDRDTRVNVLQNFSPYWELNINGLESKLERDNITFMSFNVKNAGNYDVTMTYKPKAVIYSAMVSIFLLFVILIFISVNQFFEASIFSKSR